MDLARRQALKVTGAAAVVPLLPQLAWGQAYPSRPVRLIIGFPAGGGTDLVGRLIAEWLSKQIGQQVVVENRPGASTNVATEAVAKAEPDGHTLLLIGSPQTVNASLFKNLAFDLIRDIVPIASVARGTFVVVVHPSFAAKTIPELIAQAKSKPGKINMASVGVGTPPHVAGEMFKMMAGVNIVQVPYRGDAPALADLLGGQIELSITTLGGSIEHIRAGKLRALAVAGDKRSQALPDIPTVAETLPGFEASSFWGIGAPRNTPGQIIAKLSKETAASIADPKLQARFAELGCTAFPTSTEEFKRYVEAEIEKWGKVVKFAGMKGD